MSESGSSAQARGARHVGGGYARSCAVCGAGAVCGLDESASTCTVCGSAAYVRRCPRCGRVRLLEALALLNREITCGACTFKGRLCRWRPATMADLDPGIDDGAAEVYRRHGMSLERALRDPERRFIRGLLMRQADLDLPIAATQLIFEREAVLLLPLTAPEREMLIPYASVEAVDFLPAPGFVNQAKGKHLGLTLVDFTWMSGWLALLYPFGTPEVAAQRYEVALQRVADARGLTG